MAEVDHHDSTAQLEEPHVESAEGNLTDAHSETDEQQPEHEVPAPDVEGDGVPAGDHSANGAQHDHPVDGTMEHAAGGEGEGAAATGKVSAPSSPSKPKAKTSISVRLSGQAASAPATPTVKKVRISLAM